MEWDAAVVKLLIAFEGSENADLGDDERERLQVRRLVEAGYLEPNAAPAVGWKITGTGHSAIYIAKFAERRADPALTQGTPLLSTHKGQQYVWCTDERGEVRPVPTSTFRDINPLDILAQQGWRYATREEFEAAKDRALNSIDN